MERVPADALGFVSGQNREGAWRNTYDNLKDVPESGQMVLDMYDELGIDLNEQTLDWMVGEFALVFVGIEGHEFMPLGAFATFEVSDVGRGQAAMDELMGAFVALGEVQFESRDIHGVKMQVFEDPYQDMALGYGFTDDRLVIGFMEEALRDTVDRELDPITQDSTFQSVREHLPAETMGYLYVNVERIWQLIRDNMLGDEKQSFDEDVRPYLEPVKALGVGGAAADVEEGVGKSTLFFYISKE